MYHDSWRQGPWHAGQPGAWEGTGFLAGLDGVPPFAEGNFVEWIILPPVAGQSAGQAFSAWVRGNSTSTFPIAGSVQVRYSPTGGTSTGATTASLGDFTQLLDENSNGSLNQWEELQANIPGNGRIAIRWVGNLAFSFSGTSVNLLIDSLTISNDSATPPLPQPGETIHWTTALSPIHLISQQVVPAGGTLIIDAGVQVFFDFNTPTFGGPEIHVAGGALRLEGTATAPVLLRRGINTTRVPGVGVGSNLLETVGNSGTVYAVHVDSDVSIGAGQSALLTVRDRTFSRATPIDWFSDTDSQWQTPGVSAHQATLVLENCNFHNAIAEINDSLITVSGCDFDNSRLHVVRFPIAQTVAIDGNNFRNSNVVAPFELDGYDAHLGPNNVFTNNFAPISLRGGGLTPDSVVPAIGNEYNRIFFTGSANGEIVGPLHLPPMSVPYRQWAGITMGQQFDGRINYMPGTIVEMDPGTYVSSLGPARAEVRGTPEAPVQFLQAVPGERWITFQTSNNPPLIIRNAIFDGGEFGVGGVDTKFTVHDCAFTNNIEGVRSGDYCGANISKSRFSNNAIGIHAIWGGGQGAGAEGVFYEHGRFEQ
ncbi:MAG: choice-of-anchor J domain-containing protein [Planctomycetes bacterium]|nr:choice-of-anchor J domain-containing protein [Planctomycetota bacterium]